jgi:exonuclease V gamma subunit
VRSINPSIIITNHPNALLLLKQYLNSFSVVFSHSHIYLAFLERCDYYFIGLAFRSWLTPFFRRNRVAFLERLASFFVFVL